MLLAQRYDHGAIKIREIASSEELPEKFLEAILLELKHARSVESAPGAKGGYRLKQLPSKIFLGEIIRTIDGPWRLRGCRIVAKARRAGQEAQRIVSRFSFCPRCFCWNS